MDRPLHIHNAISLLTLRVTSPDSSRDEAGFAAKLYREGGLNDAAAMTAALVNIAEDLLRELRDVTGTDPQEILQQIALRYADA